MKRREFIAGLGSAAAWPAVTRAQQGDRVRRIGVLMNMSESEPEGQARIKAFQQGLREFGWTERNLQVDYRWAGADVNRIQTYVAELVGLAPDLIVGNSTAVLTALQRATRSIPIVFVVVNDPVGAGLISSLARPGGNITGFTYLEISLIGKWLGLIKQAVPDFRRAALLFNPNFTRYYFDFLRSFASSLQPGALAPEPMPVRDTAELEQAIAAFAREPGGSVIIAADPFVVNNLGLIAKLTQQSNLPTIGIYREYALEGGLMSYGPDAAIVFRQSASYVDRILKGAKPADLPAQAPTIYNFVINQLTAKALGLEISPMLLALADEVIE
jgi:putative ABC transport system substrate-binding protein